MTKKTPQELFLRRWHKSNSVEKQIYGFTKYRKSWEDGITFKDLKLEVEKSLNKVYSKVTIYSAISSLNKFAKLIKIYLRSDSGRAENGKTEHRYFVPTTFGDINNEERDLDHKETLIHIKKDSLEHHREITIPQEQRLAEIQR